MYRNAHALVFAAGCALAHTPAAGNIYGKFNGVNDMTWWVTGLTDFDQVRDFRPVDIPFAPLPASPGLPGDGAMYCVPTATLNMYAYAARHGYPGLLPGDRSYGAWQDQSYAAPGYDAATDAISTLGQLMSTSATTGTNSLGFYAAALLTAVPQGLDVTVFKPSTFWSPRVKVAGMFGHTTGGVVSVCFGRYTWSEFGGPDNLPLLISRDSGHCVTVQRIEVDNGIKSRIWINDPGGSDDPWAQAQFASSEIEVTDREVFRLNLTSQTMSQMNVGSDGRARIIDSVYLIAPQQAFIQNEFDFSALDLGKRKGAPQQTGPKLFAPPPGATWEHVETCPLRSHFVGLSSETDPLTGRDVRHVGPMFSGGVVPMGNARVEVASNTSELLYGVDMNLFAMGPTGIDVLRPDEDFNYRSVGSLPLPTGFVPGAMAFDEDDFQLFVVDRNTGTPVIYPPYAGWGGDATPTTGRVLPAATPIGAPVMCWAHAGDGYEFILGDTDSELVRLYERSNPTTLVEVDNFRLPAGVSPRAFSPTNEGEIYITTQNNDVWCYSNTTGTWTRDESAPWDGRTGQRFQVSRSRSNVDPSLEAPFTNIPASELIGFPSVTACGPADVTTTGATLPGQERYSVPDGSVDLDDLGYFIIVWLARDPVADLTSAAATLEGQDGLGIADGVVDLDDLGYFIGVWLAGCP
ncbi:MAG: GC-type dockerin domain-anchored protein [Planctomycetota bacterium]